MEARSNILYIPFVEGNGAYGFVLSFSWMQICYEISSQFHAVLIYLL